MRPLCAVGALTGWKTAEGGLLVTSLLVAGGCLAWGACLVVVVARKDTNSCGLELDHIS